MKKTLLVVALFACVGGAQAQQLYKCHMPDGKLHFSDRLCGDISRIEVVTDKTPITAAQRREAHRVAAQNSRQLGAIEYEKAALAAERAATVKQIEADQRVANRKELIKKIEDMPMSPGRKARYILDATDAGTPGGDERIERRRREADQEAQAAHAAQAAQAAQPTVFNKDAVGSGGWDDRGNRYNGSGNTTFRSDGRTCQHVGGMVQCN